jgi:hypothetical protein
MADAALHELFMRQVIAKAREGINAGQTPFGACIVRNGRVVACEHNQVWLTTLIDKLKEWFESQLNEKKVEPNSNLGNAIKYTLKRWEPLTLFLREPGAPLVNNEVERSLKSMVLARKNSYYYRSTNGAFVGDFFMSQSCRLCGANAFEYITKLKRHADKV